MARPALAVKAGWRVQGVRYHSQNARDLLPRVLLLLTFENETGVVGKALDRAPEVLHNVLQP